MNDEEEFDIGNMMGMMMGIVMIGLMASILSRITGGQKGNLSVSSIELT
jgi:predicted lipid-binding transport protein (Tim44 family)